MGNWENIYNRKDTLRYYNKEKNILYYKKMKLGDIKIE